MLPAPRLINGSLLSVNILNCACVVELILIPALLIGLKRSSLRPLCLTIQIVSDVHAALAVAVIVEPVCFKVHLRSIQR